MDKVRDWMTAVEQLRARVSDADEVFVAWQSLLSDFYQHLPVLEKLSHNPLTVLHPLAPLQLSRVALSIVDCTLCPSGY